MEHPPVDPHLAARLRAAIREIPGFPKPGILFRDITTLLLEPVLMQEALEALWSPFHGSVDVIAGIESRGFLLGSTVAVQHRLPFVPMRKPGKLPGETFRADYTLEYGTDALEVHKDGIPSGSRVLIVDDLLATGGTAAAAVKLVESAGASISGLGFFIELTGLEGRKKLAGQTIRSLVQYEGS